MKLLMIYCDSFAYKPAIKNLEGVEEHTDSKKFNDTQVAYIQAEEGDESPDRQKSIEKKLLNYIKWICRKNETNNIVLHSFAHLSESKASAEFTKALFDRVEQRLKNVDFNVSQTPFGYFLDLDVQAPGFSLARVFRDFN